MEIIETTTGYKIIYYEEGITDDFFDIGGSEIHVFRFDVFVNFHFIRIGQYKRRLTYSMIVWVADDILGTPYYWTSGLYYVSLGRRSKVVNIGKEEFVHMNKKKFIPNFVIPDDRDVAYIHVKNLENTGNVYRIKEYESFPPEW